MDEVNSMTRSSRQYQPPVATNPIPLTPMIEKLKMGNEPDEDVVLKQLKKTQANISIWSLLLSSYPHRQALCKALGEHQVPTDTSP